MLPRVIVFNAVSLDGRIDWFLPDIEQYYRLVAHWNEDATLAGADTILNIPDAIPPEDETAFERPSKNPEDKRPLLVITDSRGRVRCWHFLRQQPYWRDCIALCSTGTPPDYIEYLEKRHIDYIVAGEDKVNLRQALDKLNARYHIKTVRAESGGTLNGALLREGLVSEVSLLIYPSLVGGITPRSFFRAPDLTAPEDIIPLTLLSVEQLENSVIWLRYRANR